MSLSRREALRRIAAAGAASVVSSKVALAAKAKAPTKPEIIEDPRTKYPSKKSTEDKYRQEFADTYGDKSEHGYAYHCVNCQGNCAWQVWVKDGKVTRENQSASYPAINPKIPDYNPRGCNKGAQHSQTMYTEERLLHPLKRVGKRGEGKWKRISWDEAATEVAKNIYETMLEKGPAGNYVHIGAGVISEARGASIKRLGSLLGAVRPYTASYVGDMFPGVSLVYGEGNVGCTMDFFYKSDVLVFWGCNPNTSRIPDAHFVWEAKYNGAKVIVISPEFNATCVHADVWVPVRAGFDGQLAMSAAYVMVKEKLVNWEFVKEFTDLPFLVRKDNKKLLRQEDLDTGHASFDSKVKEIFDEKAGDHSTEHEDEIFAVWNAKNKKITVVPGSHGSPIETLRLKDRGWDIDPALSGTYTAVLKGGKKVEVVPAFELFKEELDKYSPEATESQTGVHPSMVRELARDIAKSDVGVVTMGFTLGKYFNGMLAQRAVSSLTALTGKLGPKGGINTENEWSISGLSNLSAFAGKYRHRFASGAVSEFMLGDGFDTYEKAYSDEDVKRATGMSKVEYRKKIEKMLEVSEGDEGMDKGKPYWNDMETFLLFADARFRRNKGAYRKAFLKKAKFFAYCDYRMSETATFADILLPAKSHYEVWDIRTNPGYHRYANIAHPPANLTPIGESRSEWDIATLVVEKIQELALKNYKKSGDKKAIHIADKSHTDTGFRDLENLVKDFTQEGKVRTDKDAVEFALANVDQFKPNTIKSMYDNGGHLTLNERAGKSSPLYPDQPYNTFENELYLRQKFETLSGRLTFYVDDDDWISSGAHVPTVGKPMRPKADEFLLMTPHARWSIHSTYKTSPVLLRLQRGKPNVAMNPEVAKARGIKDGDEIKMHNALGESFVTVKLAPAVPKDALVMEHGWEPFMFKGKKGHNQLVGDMLNLLETTDGWGHLKFGINWDGNQHAYANSVSVSKV